MQAPVPFNAADLDMLIIHALRMESVLSESVVRLTSDDFESVYERPHELLWVIAADFFKQHNKMIPGSIMMAEMDRRMMNQPDFSMQSTQQSVFHLAIRAFEFPATDLVATYGLSLLERFLYERRVGKALAELRSAEQQGIQPTREQLKALNDTADKTQISTAAISTPFMSSPEEALFGTEPKQPTGVIFIDQALGGGVQPKRLYGLIAPSGGGKTTLSNQVGVSYAMMGHHTLVCSYEEPITAEYMAPVYANATRIKRSRIESIRSINELTEPERVLYKKGCEKVGRYLHFADMSGKDNAGSGGAPEIEQMVVRLINSGIKLEAVIIDWFWVVAKRAFSTVTVQKGKQSDDRQFSQQLMDDIRRIAVKYDLWIWINQQTAPAAATKKGSANWNESAEFKSFAWLLSGCFCLNAMDANQIAEINLSKGRMVQANKQHVQLDGEYGMFKPLDGDMEWDERARGFVKNEARNKVPKPDAPKPKSAMESDFEGGRPS